MTPDPGVRAAGNADVVAMLDRLAGVIVDALGFGVAVLNLTRPDGFLEVVSVAGDPGAVDMLLGTADSAANWDALLSQTEAWGSLLYLDHASPAAGDPLTWVPDLEPVQAPDAWHPGDELFAPLVATDGTRLGILSVGLPAAGRRPDPQTRKALEAFAFSASLAIEHPSSRLLAEASEQRFRRLATSDWLTGCGNRSVLLDRLAPTAPPTDAAVSALLFIDLDGFKAVNDRHSHAAGDHLLRTVADRIQGLLRPQDILVRWGGDEFLVLLEGLDGPAEATRMAARIADEVAQPVAHGDRMLSVTASTGVALRHPGDETDAEELVRRADAEMYRAKREARGSRQRVGDLAGVVVGAVPAA